MDGMPIEIQAQLAALSSFPSPSASARGLRRHPAYRWLARGREGAPACAGGDGWEMAAKLPFREATEGLYCPPAWYARGAVTSGSARRSSVYATAIGEDLRVIGVPVQLESHFVGHGARRRVQRGADMSCSCTESITSL